MAGPSVQVAWKSSLAVMHGWAPEGPQSSHGDWREASCLRIHWAMRNIRISIFYFLELIFDDEHSSDAGQGNGPHGINFVKTELVLKKHIYNTLPGNPTSVNLFFWFCIWFMEHTLAKSWLICTLQSNRGNKLSRGTGGTCVPPVPEWPWIPRCRTNSCFFSQTVTFWRYLRTLIRARILTNPTVV